MTHKGRAQRALGLAAMLMVAACGGGGPGSKGKPRGTPPAPSPALAGADLSWGGYQLKLPEAMTSTAVTGGIRLDKPDPASSYGFGCRLFVLQPVARSGTIDQQAAAFLQQLADASQGQVVIGIDYPSPLDGVEHVIGVTGEGRAYSQLDGRLVMASNHNSVYGKVRALAVDLGSQAGVIVGFQPWDAKSKCFQEIYEVRDWELIAYSLTFPGVPANPGAFRSALVGGWFSANFGTSFSTGASDTFAANGNYADSFTAETYHQISPTEIEQVDSTWSGDGVWAVTGNVLTIWHDDPARPARSQYARITTDPFGATFLYQLSRAEDGSLFDAWTKKD